MTMARRIQVNLTIAWTLPFVIIGLGVDNIYIVLLSLQKQADYSEKSFLRGMREVMVPITMTSLVNLRYDYDSYFGEYFSLI